MSTETERLASIRSDLHGDVGTVLSALGRVSDMATSERIALLGDLLPLCLSQKLGKTARELVLTLPRTWLLANIEKASEPLLGNANNLDYLMLLGLFETLDHALAVRLARKASLSDDFDIREVGADFLNSKMDAVGLLDKRGA